MSHNNSSRRSSTLALLASVALPLALAAPLPAYDSPSQASFQVGGQRYMTPMAAFADDTPALASPSTPSAGSVWSSSTASGSKSPTILNFAPPADGMAVMTGDHQLNETDPRQFWLRYDNAWMATDNSLRVSLPNVTSTPVMSQQDAGDSSDPDDQDSDRQFHNAHQSRTSKQKKSDSVLSYSVFLPTNFDFAGAMDGELPSIYSSGRCSR